MNVWPKVKSSRLKQQSSKQEPSLKNKFKRDPDPRPLTGTEFDAATGCCRTATPKSKIPHTWSSNLCSGPTIESGGTIALWFHTVGGGA